MWQNTSPVQALANRVFGDKPDLLVDTSLAGQIRAVAELPIDNPTQALAIYNLAKRLEKDVKTMMANVQTFAQTSPDPIVNEEGQVYTHVEATAIYVIGLGRMTEEQERIAEENGMLDIRDASSWRFMGKKGK